MALNVVEFPGSNLSDIPARLRAIADDIEAGEFGEIRECVVVAHGSRLEVFGLGAADGTVSHYLLACAQRKIEAPMLGGE